MSNIAFLYPSQGSQKVGMGFDLYQTYPEAREKFDLADHTLGFSLSSLCFEGPEKELSHDLNAQLAVYTVSCIVTDVLRMNNVLPDVVSGYSSGFYAAAYAAGCVDFAHGLSIVRRAGEILLDEGRLIDGSMAAIFGLPLKKLERICLEVGDVEVAIHNTPRQSIVSGIDSSVKRAMERSLTEGALDAYILSAATAYHSRFMAQSSARFLREIKNTNMINPRIPLISYLSLDYVRNERELSNIMAAQLSRPVLWVDLIKKISTDCTKSVLEVGPGEVISRTVRWIDRSIKISNTATEGRLLKSIQRYGR